MYILPVFEVVLVSPNDGSSENCLILSLTRVLLTPAPPPVAVDEGGLLVMVPAATSDGNAVRRRHCAQVHFFQLSIL